MKFLDLCAGIGGFRLGLERAGMECMGYCEIDKFARKSYEAMYNTQGEWSAQDIRSVSDEEIQTLHADLICGGFPCQPFSIAGKRRGFDDPRGNIFGKISRFVEIIHPRWVVFENVRNLLSHDHGQTFNRLLKRMDELGYCMAWAILNSANYGVPQSRKRLYLVGSFGTVRAGKVFRIGRDSGPSAPKLQELTHGLRDAHRVYSEDGTARTLKAEGGGLGAKTGLYLCSISKPSGTKGGIREASIKNVGADCANTITSHYSKGLSEDNGNVVLDGKRIRRLTPRECWRLQGFPDEYFDKAQAAGLSDTQLYKQAGNAVTVPVAEWIGRRIIEAEEV